MKGEGRGEDRRRPGDFLSPAWAGRSQLYMAEPGDLSRRAQSTQRAPLLEKVGEDAQRRACMEMVGAGGRLVWQGHRSFECSPFPLCWLSATLLFHACSPSTARAQADLFTCLGLSTLSQTQNVCLSSVLKILSHSCFERCLFPNLSSLLQNSLLNAN